MQRTINRITLAALALGLALATVASTVLAGPAGSAEVTVSIVEPNYDNTDTWTFDPNTVRIKVGDSVIWVNKGADPHDVTAEDGTFVSGPEGNMNPGDTFKFTFTAAGAFSYICAAHPWMRGTVVVE